MSPKIQDIIGKVTNPLSKPAQPFTSSSLYYCKSRFSLIGTVGSGKSTVAALIGLTTQTLSSVEPEFFCRIIERNSDIYADISNLRSGRFPAKTAPLSAFATEAGLLLAKKKTPSFLGMKQLQMPICDVSGEDLQLNIRQYAAKMGNLGAAAYSAFAQLTRYVKECDGMIVCVDASRAVLGRDIQIKTEDDKYLHFDPDVNLVRILNDVFDYREQIRRPLKGIAIVITKWDELKPHVEHLGLDLFNPTQNDMAVFMDTFFPSVSQAIKSYILTNNSVRIAYFPMYVEIERNEDGTEKRRKEDKSLIVKAKQSNLLGDLRKPSYAEQSCANLIEWLLGFAT